MEAITPSTDYDELDLDVTFVESDLEAAVGDSDDCTDECTDDGCEDSTDCD